MPRYIVKFEDGTQEQIGAPGRDSEKIRQTVSADAERKKGKKVVGIQQVKTNGNAKSAKKATTPKAPGRKASTKKLVRGKKAAVAKGTKTTKGKGRGRGKAASAKNASFDSNSLKTQVTALENTLSSVVQDLTYQIKELRSSILLARRQELMIQLDEIESQL